MNARECCDDCAKMIDDAVRPLLESGSLPPMWPWWLPLVDAVAERLSFIQPAETDGDA